jgi:hypothetical protein
MSLGVIKALRLRVSSLAAAKIDKSRSGIGISDWSYLAGLLAFKFNYVNSYYHQFPKVDLKAPPTDLKNKCDFITCSDVLEHVLPPLQDSLDGLYLMIRDGGFLIVSVPISKIESEVDEHYLGLVDYRVGQEGGEVNVTGVYDDGFSRTIPKPIFHGGPGYTLEMRKFSLTGFRKLLAKTGFEVVEEISITSHRGLGGGTAPVFVCRKPNGGS